MRIAANTQADLDSGVRFDLSCAMNSLVARITMDTEIRHGKPLVHLRGGRRSSLHRPLPMSGKDGFHSVPLLFEEIGDGVESVLTRAILAPMQQMSAVAHTLLTN